MQPDILPSTHVYPEDLDTFEDDPNDEEEYPFWFEEVQWDIDNMDWWYNS